MHPLFLDLLLHLMCEPIYGMLQRSQLVVQPLVSQLLFLIERKGKIDFSLNFMKIPNMNILSLLISIPCMASSNLDIIVYLTNFAYLSAPL